MTQHRVQLHRSLALAAALTLVVGAAAACSDDEPSSAGTDTTVEPSDDGSTTTALPEGGPVEVPLDGDIYALAEDFEPGEPGEVIALQPVEVSALEGADASVWRVLYHSESLQGEDIAVSGVIVVPSGAAPEGGRDVLTWAHGTTGIADECAPSKDIDDNGLSLAVPFVERDMVVVATDYEGLGTPGRHPYIAGESEGRGTLDIVRAAIELQDLTGASPRTVIWGHSQGGHAALFANQIAPDWAPELEVVGTVAGAPPSQLNLIAAALKDSPFRYYLGMVAAGWAAAFPEADPGLVLTEEGLARLDQVDDGCTGPLAQSWNDVPYDELVKADPASVEPWASLLVENDPGFVVGASPVLIIHGGDDEQIPVVSSELLLARMCGIGQVVQRRVYDGQSHAGVIGPSMDDMLGWIDARLAGDAPPDDCAEG